MNGRLTRWVMTRCMARVAKTQKVRQERGKDLRLGDKFPGRLQSWRVEEVHSIGNRSTWLMVKESNHSSSGWKANIVK